MAFNPKDIAFMRRALFLARSAKGITSPNPAVGAVIVKNGKIIAEGKTQCCGLDHAEVDALKKAGTKSQNADLYVTLEPCCHHGRTPPCTDAIVKAGIRRVVYSVRDPNKKVCGFGHKSLVKAGILVEHGLLQEEAAILNEDFFKFIRTGKPFITAKIAQTWDGGIATFSGDSQWITSVKSRKEVHKLRAKYDAVLVGIGTVLKDDPRLSVRHVKGRNPVRIIFDTYNRLPKNFLIAQTAKNTRTIAVCKKKPKQALPYIEYWEIPAMEKKISIPLFLKKAGKENITSILVEGGAQIFSSFLHEKSIDKLIVFMGNKILGKGRHAFDGRVVNRIFQSIQIDNVVSKQLGNDVMITGYPKYKVKSNKLKV
jgi:diaminohydroxyphosphoribosylaminopyrimidine deaminase/5-amino-6-(5-phosphoribosylamino)uracil reductase